MLSLPYAKKLISYMKFLISSSNVFNSWKEQLFASKYKLYLPTEEELREEIETQKAIFYLQQKDAEEEAGGEPNA